MTHSRSPLSRFNLLALAAAALLPWVPAAVSATPVVYTFTTSAGVFGNADAPSQAVIAALGPNAFVSGSFIYDAGSPATGTANGGLTIYGNAAGTTASYSGLSGSVGGFGFSDPRGFVLVGDNKPLGSLTSTDSVQYYADSFTVGGTHNFAGPTLGGVQIVNMRLFWDGAIGGAGDFLSNQSLPGAPPSFAGLLALDLISPGNPNTISTEAVFFNNLMVQAAPVPEPQTYALMLAGLALLGVAAARKRKQG